MAVRAEEIASILREQIEQFESPSVATDVGVVIEAGDGVARAHGLANARYSELLEFPNGVMGLAPQPRGRVRQRRRPRRLRGHQGRR